MATKIPSTSRIAPAVVTRLLRVPGRDRGADPGVAPPRRRLRRAPAPARPRDRRGVRASRPPRGRSAGPRDVSGRAARPSRAHPAPSPCRNHVGVQGRRERGGRVQRGDPPRIGSATSASHRSRTSLEDRCPRSPRRSRAGRRRRFVVDVARLPVEPDDEEAGLLQPSDRRGMFATRACGRCTSAPADARMAAGVTGAARLILVTSIAAPATSADRAAAPRFWGSSMPSSRTTTASSANVEGREVSLAELSAARTERGQRRRGGPDRAGRAPNERPHGANPRLRRGIQQLAHPWRRARATVDENLRASRRAPPPSTARRPATMAGPRPSPTSRSRRPLVTTPSRRRDIRRRRPSSRAPPGVWP